MLSRLLLTSPRRSLASSGILSCKSLGSSHTPLTHASAVIISWLSRAFSDVSPLDSMLSHHLLTFPRRSLASSVVLLCESLGFRALKAFAHDFRGDVQLA